VPAAHDWAVVTAAGDGIGHTADVLIIGGGIAGAAAGWALTRLGITVTLAEAEPVCGHHTTGRSAAAFLANYGPAGVRALTRESEPLLTDPGALVDHPLLTRRPTLHVAAAGDERAEEALAAELATAREAGVTAEWVTGADLIRAAPFLRPGWASAGVLEPDTSDLDVAGLHHGFLRAIRRSPGGSVHTGARIVHLTDTGDRWLAHVAGPGAGPHADAQQAGATVMSARVLVNAAGAWADEVALLAGARPRGLRPLRRTAFTAPVALTPALAGDLPRGPLVHDALSAWYVKPEGVGILGSLADETPDQPGDVRPDPADVAMAIERINAATVLGIRSVQRAWAGLRTFAPDGELVLGPDPRVARFIWYAGLGGYGIQTAPRAGTLVAEAAAAQLG